MRTCYCNCLSMLILASLGSDQAVARGAVPLGTSSRRLGPVEVVCVDPQATGYATFQSHNQKVVSTAHGIFMTHIRSRNKEYTAQTWRLLRSTDGGGTFTVIFEATHATNPPVLESDEDGNIYLVRVDFQNGDAYLYRFLAERDFRKPIITPISGGAAGKFVMMCDPRRRQLYFFSHNNTFHTMGLNGQVQSRQQLLRNGEHAILQYPLLSLGHDGTLHAAWTTQKHGVYMYWDIHHMQSPDGGVKWQNLDGTPLELPVVADEGGPALRITLDDEFDSHTWLSSFLAKGKKLHFVYLAQTKPRRQHYMRYDVATGRRDVHHQPEFKGKTIRLAGLDGFFATRSRVPGSPLYCVMQDQGHVACLASDDNGKTWYDHAKSEDKFAPYSIGGCREITSDGYIIGSFTDQASDPQSAQRSSRVYFFKIRATSNRER